MMHHISTNNDDVISENALHHNRIKLNLFFRKPRQTDHSIERLYSCISTHLQNDASINHHVCPEYSNGIVARLKNIAFALRLKKAGFLTHITGDVHYIIFGFRPFSAIITMHDFGILKTRSLIKRIALYIFWFLLPALLARKVVLISEFTLAEYRKCLPFLTFKACVIRNCVDDIFASRASFNYNHDGAVLLVGTSTNKNVVFSITAMEGIDREIWIVGPITEQLHELLQSTKARYRSWLNISSLDLLELYKSSSLLLFPSTYEGFGLPILEAQAVGIPVITSQRLPMTDVAGDGALFVNPDDPKEIRQAVVKILEDKTFATELIERGQRNVKYFHAERIAAEYLQLYQSLSN